MDSNTDLDYRYSNLFLNAYINRQAHTDMFFYIVLTSIYTTSGLWSTGNTRKYQQIDVYIYQCDHLLYDAIIGIDEMGTVQLFHDSL